MNNNIEIIYWKDASGHDDQVWRDLDEIQELYPADIVTVGFVIEEADDYIIVVNSHDLVNDKFHGDMCILKSSITDRKLLAA